MWSITAIFLGIYVTANKCDDDINAASQEFAQGAIRIRNATTYYKIDSDWGIAELSSVVEYMEAAKLPMSRAIAGCLTVSEDCEDDVKFTGQDLVIIGFKAMEGIEDCVLSPSNRCSGDVSVILSAMNDAIADLGFLATDCDFAPGSDCEQDIALFAEQLNGAKEMLIKAETDCKANKDACVEDMLLGVSEFFDACSDGMMAIYYCTNFSSRRHDH